MACNFPVMHELGGCDCAPVFEPLQKLALEHPLVRVYNEDSANVTLTPNSLDAIVTDPPAGIGFMNKEWDGDKGGRETWSQWLADTLKPWFDALKPGGHALVWAIPRTSHWTATALELCGFELRDVVHDIFSADVLLENFLDGLNQDQYVSFLRLIESQASPIVYHLFGTGFPKSLNLARQAGCEAWEGWGTALKPAAEHWILCRKPLAGTVARNVLTFGTGGLNIDACRIGSEPRPNLVSDPIPASESAGHTLRDGFGGSRSDGETTEGRWPAHVTLSHGPDCELLGTAIEDRPMLDARSQVTPSLFGAMGGSKAIGTASVSREVYRCAPGCPVAALDAQSGLLHARGNKNPSTGGGGQGPTKYDGAKIVTNHHARSELKSDGGASRFFYVSKAPRKEKDAGLGHLPVKSGGEATDRTDGSAGLNNPRAGAGRTGGSRNFHPTVKSLALMRWLVKLVCPPGGVVADPFAGSGSTAVAALEEGMRAVVCERDSDYLPIILGRIQHALKELSWLT